VSDTDNETKQLVAEALRAARNRARSGPKPRAELPAKKDPLRGQARLQPLPQSTRAVAPVSPDRERLNEKWDVARALDAPPRGRLGRLFAPLKKPIGRVIRFALGPFIENQVEMNSAQVQFDNDIVAYIDERIDRIAAHYDGVLGQHGKRMEEIDERHLILQQELIQHVHDLVKRIDFVFETAEQNHLYLEGFLRELSEQLAELASRMESSLSTQTPGKDET
jgi:hypothetical protein